MHTIPHHLAHALRVNLIPEHGEKSSVEFARLRILSVFFLSSLGFYVLSNYTSSGISIRLRAVQCSAPFSQRIVCFQHAALYACFLAVAFAVAQRVFHRRMFWSLSAPSANGNGNGHGGGSVGHRLRQSFQREIVSRSHHTRTGMRMFISDEFSFDPRPDAKYFLLFLSKLLPSCILVALEVNVNLDLLSMDTVLLFQYICTLIPCAD